MRREATRLRWAGRSRTAGRFRAALIAASLVLCAWTLSPAVAQQPDPSRESQFEPLRSRNAPNEPSFFVLPIRTELQRLLVANGKPVQAMVVLNGFVTIGKKGVERMRALDILALRRALADIKARDHDASVVFVIGFLGIVPPGAFDLTSKEQPLLTKECRELAKEAKLRAAQISGTFIGTPGIWPKVVAAAQAIDLAKEIDHEKPATDTDVRAFPVRTKVSEFLTSWCQGGTAQGADCVVYIGQPIHADDTPLISAALEARLAGVIKRLNLSRKNRIDYHLVVNYSDRAAGRRDRDAISDRFVGKEANALNIRLGFNDNSTTW